MLGKVSFSALFASLRLNGPLERNRRSLKNFAPPSGFRISAFGFPSGLGFRVSDSAGLRISATLFVPISSIMSCISSAFPTTGWDSCLALNWHGRIVGYLQREP